MSEESANIDSEMMQFAEEALSGSSESSGVAPDGDTSVEQVEAAIEAVSDDQPQQVDESASSEPQSDEKQTENEKLIKQAVFDREVSKLRASRREARDEATRLKEELLEAQENFKLLQAQQQEFQRLMSEREVLDPMEQQLQAQHFKMQQMEAQQRIAQQRQTARLRAQEEARTAELREQFIHQATDLSEKYGVPAEHILLKYSDSDGSRDMESFAKDLETQYFNHFKERLAKHRQEMIKGTPKPIKPQAGARNNMLDYKDDAELEANMEKFLSTIGEDGVF